ncbi:MAG: hypothetical protein K6B67_05375 [Lachnospiraceae bacterium]|nr:hypothetical protein [Lachnospiraceae bacterium]
MEEIIKAFTGLLFTLIVAFLGVSLISSSIDARNAQAYMSEAVQEISSSNCSNSVINYYKTHATEVNDTYQFDVSSKTASTSANRYVATATLKYKYRIPLIALSEDKVIVSEIR